MNCYQKFLQKNIYRTCDRNCKQIASTTPQMWLVAGSHLGFAENLFKLRNDKFRVVMARSLLRRRGHLSASCHRERGVAICWQVDCRAVYSTRLAMTRTERQV